MFYSQQGRIFLFATVSRVALSNTQVHIYSLLGFFSCEVKWLGCGAPSISAEVKNAWSYTAFPTEYAAKLDSATKLMNK